MRTETEAQKAKRKAKEARQLAKLLEMHGKDFLFHGFWFLLVILTVIYIADEITSHMTDKMKSDMIFDLFNIANRDINSDKYSSAIQMMAIATIPTYFITAINPIYKTLADKFGRKAFLVINTLGMGLGMLICMIAPNIYVFVVGMVVMGFFTPNDMQVIYLMETAPKEHRAKLCSITKGIGLLSVSLIGVLRSIFYNPEKLSSWRLVYLIPVLTCFIISLMALFFTRETPVFVKSRLEYLEKTDEEREREKKEAASKEVSIGAAFRYIMRSGQLKTIGLILLIFSVGVAMSGYTNEVLMSPGHITDAQKDVFLMIEPIVYAIFAFFSGFITDALGRKNSGFIFGLCAIIGQVAFVFGAKAGMGPVALAIFDGLMYGGMWSLSDLLFFTLPAESTPTHIRSTVCAVMSYTYITNMLTAMITGIFFTKITAAGIGTFQLWFFVPAMLISMLLLKTRVEETKDTDLSEIE